MTDQLGPAVSKEELAAEMQRLRVAIGEDASKHGEQWTPGKEQGADFERGLLKLRAVIRLDRDALDLTSFESGENKELAEASFEERIAAAEYLLSGTSTRLMREKLATLQRFAAAGSGGDRAERALEKLVSSRARIVAALTRCLMDETLTVARAAFDDALRNLPRDMDVFTLIAEEVGEIYWDELMKVVVAYRASVKAYLAALDDYAVQLDKQTTASRYAFLAERRQQLGERLAHIIGELDGERLHQGKEILRRQLESAGKGSGAAGPRAQPAKTSETLWGRLMRKGSDEAPSAAAESTHTKESSELEEAFESLQKLKQRLMKERDRVRNQIQAVDAEFAEAGIQQGDLGAKPGEIQTDILQKMKILIQQTAQFNRAKVPLEALLTGLPGNGKAALLQRVDRLVAAVGAPLSFSIGNDITYRLLHLFWTDPLRLLEICYRTADNLATGVFEQDKKRAKNLKAWLSFCVQQAAHVEHSLEQYVTLVEHTAPEQIAPAVSEECRFMFGSTTARGSA